MLSKGIATIWCFAMSLGIADSFGQAQADTDNLDTKLLLYQTGIGNSLHLYRGKEYIGHLVRDQQAVFLENSYALTGSVNVDGTFYQGIVLGYDLVGDELVVTNLKGRILVPQQNKIRGFSLADRHFSRIDMTQEENPRGETLLGFFEEIYQSDHVRLVAKRKRILNENHDKQRVQFLISDADMFYLIKHQRIFPITRKSSFRKAYPSLVREIKAFHKRQKIDFRRDFERSVISTVIFCETR